MTRDREPQGRGKMAGRSRGEEAVIGRARFQGDRVWLTLCIWRPQLSQQNGPSSGVQGVGVGERWAGSATSVP